MSDIRLQWDQLRTALVEEAARSKQSQDVIAGLANAYRRLGVSERAIVNEVLTEWLLSDDVSARFDARVLVRQLAIDEALPALQTLGERLTLDSSARARHERAAVLDVISELAQAERDPN